MRFFTKTVLTLSAFACFAVPSAQASVFKWQAEDRSVSVTFPDTWARISNQKPEDILTISAPGTNDYAGCKISAIDDARYMIYPASLGSAVQHVYASKSMWKDYYEKRYARPAIHAVYDDASLDEGNASIAYMSYDTAVGMKMRKRGVALASYYGDKLFIVECSAQEASYDKWHAKFMDFMHAVDLRHYTNDALSGFYRDFIADCGVKIKGISILEDSYY